MARQDRCSAVHAQKPFIARFIKTWALTTRVVKVKAPKAYQQ